MLLRPRPPVSGGALAIRAGLACVDALDSVSQAFAPRLKWPNDIMVVDRKVAGLLCEARWSGESPSWIAVGVGINTRGPVPAALRDRAVALDDVVPGTSRAAVLAALAPRFAALSATPGPLSGEERGRFLGLAWSPDGERVEDIAADGALLVRRGGVLERRVDAA
jgi:BirA family biotin operon repressor/biotin-[acetyl-CoA-carboxylase] ligase